MTCAGNAGRLPRIAHDQRQLDLRQLRQGPHQVDRVGRRADLVEWDVPQVEGDPHPTRGLDLHRLGREAGVKREVETVDLRAIVRVPLCQQAGVPLFQLQPLLAERSTAEAVDEARLARFATKPIAFARNAQSFSSL